MNPHILHIETLVPPYACGQDTVAERLAEWADNPRTARVIKQIFRRSGIVKRHSVIPDFGDFGDARLFSPGPTGRVEEPGTEERNRLYIAESEPLIEKAARRALRACGLGANEVTHVVTVSCTGFHNPGPDYTLVTALGMSPAVERYNLGFMGCYAAFPALRMARQFCLADPKAVVLVVCAELCTLHMQLHDDTDAILANALFADGVACAVVSGREPARDRPALELGPFHSALAPEGRKDMAWEIGDRGFNLVLSTYVPDVIGLNIAPVAAGLCERAGIFPEAVDRWAVHPGGKAILDRIEQSLELRPEQLRESRRVLAEFGNMSSATVLFVLRNLLADEAVGAGRIGAMAFGPGLVIESAMLRRAPARAAKPRGASIAIEFK